MRSILIIFLTCLSCQIFAQKSSHLGAAKFSPDDGKKLLIIGQDLAAVGGLGTYGNGYVNNLDQVPAGVTTYTGFPGVSGLKTKANWGAGDIHAQAYIDEPKFKNTTIVIGLDMVGQLSSIIHGYSDNDIEFLGQWIKDQSRPVFLRMGYEFDGSWNSYDPASYKNAWIYIVKYFDEMDIRNVAYVWQAAGINTPNIDRWYPGDEYVNWLGYSHFDESNPGQNIRDFAEVHDKPIMIAESTPRRNLNAGDGATHWSAWFDPLFTKIYDNSKIKALAYINSNWESQSMWKGQGWGDSRVEVNSFIKTAWQNEIAKDSWLLASDDLHTTLKYQEWMNKEVITSITENECDEIEVNRLGTTLLVKTKSGRQINGIQLWDTTGKEIYSNLKSCFEYTVSTNLLPAKSMIIIKMIMDNEVIVRKIGFEF